MGKKNKDNKEQDYLVKIYHINLIIILTYLGIFFAINRTFLSIDYFLIFQFFIFFMSDIKKKNKENENNFYYKGDKSKRKRKREQFKEIITF